MQPVVIDTNVALDLLVFSDPRCAALKQALEAGDVRWLATPAMRVELERVLSYPKIVPRMAYYALDASAVLQRFDAWVHSQADAPRARMVCTDADDQCFVDLAVAHRALLVSKDRAVLALARRLLPVGVRVMSHYAALDGPRSESEPQGAIRAA